MPNRIKTALRYISLMMIGLLLGMGAPSVLAAGAMPEVRVLIDVSGSMKQTDPKNLRQPALRLLIGILPRNSRAGVWNFAQGASMQVSPGMVTDKWREQARQRATRIHSRGLYTNIEDALNASTRDWDKPDHRIKRNLILLTDGMVDISKDKGKNTASRERILKTILPRLKKAGVKVHTIALSKNTDEELLRTLSTATDGGFVQVDSADELERIFLKLFEKTADVDAVPIMENKFKVDKSVRDFTILIFRAPGDTKPAAVISPSNKRYTIKQHPRSIDWHHEKNYDLVTVSNPEAGEWSLDTTVDPDNRVMIVTNLNLKVDSLPNNMMMGDELVIRGRLLQDRKTITDKKLLALMRFTVHRRLGSESLPVVDLLDDGQNRDTFAGDGVYSGTAGHFTKPGIYDLTLKVISDTFNREAKHRLEVRGSPATIEVKKQTTGFEATIRIDPSMLQTETVSIQLKFADGKSRIIPQLNELEWQTLIPTEYAQQEIIATLVGTRINGKSLRMDLTHKLGGAENQSLAVKLPDEAVKNSATPALEPTAPEELYKEGKEDHKEVEPVEKDKSSDKVDWLNVGGVFIGVNVIVIGLIVLIVVIIKKRRSKKGGGKAEEEVDTEI